MTHEATSTKMTDADSAEKSAGPSAFVVQDQVYNDLIADIEAEKWDPSETGESEPSEKTEEDDGD